MSRPKDLQISANDREIVELNDQLETHESTFDNENVETPQVRRSTRERRPRNPLDDFIIYLVKGSRDVLSNTIPYCFNVDSDPKTYSDTISSQDKQNSDLLLKNHNLRPTGSLATHHEKGQSSGSHKQTPLKGKDTCYRCGMTGHWGRTCRTTKHLVDLYQASVKGKEKNAEATFVNEENAPCPTLDVSDFFMDNAEIGNDFIFGENNNN
ncbi:uncharacterized protein LOC110716419 [Chenopodium quinoa]|uniref:uncharacterized protein LOC110716419 n=1 Tax=Chenopodium quinoa TaxID=63459 RepID=UPI000B799C34|nr:uncharacterized protein LOC110716419 [Chenopodium quinoa]